MTYERRVMIPAAVAVITLLALNFGCENSESAVRVTPVSVEEIAPKGAIDCAVVCVSDIAKDAQSHVGRVAVHGVVSKVFAGRRAFTVANIEEGATCCATGCGHDSIPARVPAELYSGELPKQFDQVVLVGEVVPNGEGYDFVIEEVWTGGKVVLARSLDRREE